MTARPIDHRVRLTALASRTPERLTASFPRGDSAVLLLIVESIDGDGRPGIVVTRRSRDLRTDPGFVAYPGGRVDAGESTEDAARRECAEEVGIAAESIATHGRLDDSWNGAGFRIVPVVASTPGPVALDLHEAEVSSAAVVRRQGELQHFAAHRWA